MEGHPARDLGLAAVPFAPLEAVLAADTGSGATRALHVERDAAWMGELYNFLGLSVGVVLGLSFRLLRSAGD